MRQIRVLVVDDSRLMVSILTSMIESDSMLRVAGRASNGREAVEKVLELKPDIVTLDVEMPVMNGLEALKIIMEKCPVPVLMVSSYTTEGAQTAFDALDLGAVDFIPKNLEDSSINIYKIKDHLVEKIRTIALASFNKSVKEVKKGSELNENERSADIKMPPLPKLTFHQPIAPIIRHGTKVVAIGASTGGPKALQDIFSELPENFPVGCLVVQHMPPSFIQPFAQRLDSLSKLDIRVATDGEKVEPGAIYIAPGAVHTKLKKSSNGDIVIKLDPAPKDSLHRPSIDQMILSAGEHYGEACLGLILTGMGRDGLYGSKMLKSKGGRVFVQEESTCAVYGMPRAVVENNLADKIIPLQEITRELIENL